MKSLTEHLWFETPHRRDYVNITGTVEQLAVANERNRLARDLHDILGYTLATVVVKAEAAKRLIPTDPERARGELDRLQELSRDGLAEVRRSVAATAWRARQSSQPASTGTSGPCE